MSEKEEERCPVCCVLVRRRLEIKDVFLVVARTPEGLAWCPPGGKVNEGENPKVAALRELEEETGLSILSDDLRFVHSAPHVEVGDVEVSVYFCEYRDCWFAPPRAAEGCPVAWMTWEEICADVFGEFYKRLPTGFP